MSGMRTDFHKHTLQINIPLHQKDLDNSQEMLMNFVQLTHGALVFEACLSYTKSVNSCFFWQF